MTKHILLFGLAIMLVSFYSCYDEGSSLDEDTSISPEVLKLIANHGFSTDGAYKVAEGYLVEGDIVLTDAQLQSHPLHLRVPTEEQYHTFNLVTAVPRVIKVGFHKKLHSSIKSATLAAMQRYNNQNLTITFEEGGNGGGPNASDIIISKAPKRAQYLASAGFPTSGGDPHNSIKVNQDYLLSNGWATNTIISIMAHEIGHCIGFRHTDWYERQISCGGDPGQYEGQENSGVGAVHIPGTPSYQSGNVDGSSFMLSCIGNGTNRPFSNPDVTALNCLYDTGTPCTN